MVLASVAAKVYPGDFFQYAGERAAGVDREPVQVWLTPEEAACLLEALHCAAEMTCDFELEGERERKLAAKLAPVAGVKLSEALGEDWGDELGEVGDE